MSAARCFIEKKRNPLSGFLSFSSFLDEALRLAPLDLVDVLPLGF